MKKILLFLGLLVAACSSVKGYDKEFKNPIFNQLLRPLGKTTGYAYLTPTSVKFSQLFDKDKIDYVGKCDLVENEQDRITLKCDGEWFDGSKDSSYFTYIIKKEFFTGCLLIGEYSYDTPKDYPHLASYSSYCTTPPDYKEKESESD